MSRADVTLKQSGKSNIHACGLVIADTGLLIFGPSGSGKTSLMNGLIEAARQRSVDAKMISDDQVFLYKDRGRLVAAAPESIRGRVEIHGHGIGEIKPEALCPSHRIDLAASLEDDETIERMPEPESLCLLGVEVPKLRLPVRHEAQGVRIILARLGIF